MVVECQPPDDSFIAGLWAGLGNSLIDDNCSNYRRFPPVSLVLTAVCEEGQMFVLMSVEVCLWSGAGRAVLRRGAPTHLQLVPWLQLVGSPLLTRPPVELSELSE